MPVRHLTCQPESLTVEVEAEFAATAEQVWALWAEPRLLERWWGPPGFPCTIGRHDLQPGGRVTYRIVGPDGAGFSGEWTLLEVEATLRLCFDDVFADDHGPSLADMPVTRRTVTLAQSSHGVGMTMVSTFRDRAAMDQLLQMGVLEGMRNSWQQMEPLLLAD